MFRFAILILFSLHVKAMDTKFSWVSPKGAPQKGKCFELDTKTDGSIYKKKVEARFCRPKDVQLQWIQQDSIKGQCFELDNETGGFNYFNQVNAYHCIPKTAYYKFFKDKCFALDESAYGKGFSLNVSNSKCKLDKKDIYYYWDNDKVNYAGKCYKRDKATSGVELNLKVSMSNCYPKKIAYKLEAVKGEILCLGYDKELGPSQFISKFNNHKCADLHPYELKVIEGVLKCLTHKDSVAQEVSFHKCRPDKVIYKWIQRNNYEGTCTEYPKEGESIYQKLVVAQKCSPKKTVHRFIYNNGKSSCVELDTKTHGDEFAIKVSSNYCKVATGKYFFKVAKDGHGGDCIFQNTIHKDELKKVKRIHCRPAKVKLVWVTRDKYRGNCYEVDVELGHKAFSKRISTKDCKTDTSEYMLINEKGENSRCFEWDKPSRGQKYIQEVNVLKCKKEL
jgi:hypothetical protein